jgi:ATP-binding cassette subfamily C protein LapB
MELIRRLVPFGLGPPRAQPDASASYANPLRDGVRVIFDPVVMTATLVINLLSLALPAVLLQVYDRIIPNQTIDTLTLLVCALVVAFAFDAILRSARAALAGWAGARYEFRIGAGAVARLLHADPRAAEVASVGVSLDRLSAIDQLREFYANQGATVLVDLPFIILFLGFIWAIAGALVLVPITLMLVFAVLALLIGRSLRDALAERSTVDDRRMSFIIEILSGVLTLKALAMETLMVRRYERLMNSAAQGVHRTALLSGMAQNLGNSFTQLGAFSVAAAGALFVLDGSLTMGGLAACTMLAGRALQPMLRAMGIWTSFQAIRVAHGRIQAIYAMPLEPGFDGPPLEIRDGTIELDDVRFSYDPKRPVLDGVSLRIGAGECIGISGGNGTGKSTLLALMAGMNLPDRGTIRIDGVPIGTVDRRSFVRQIAVLPQHCMLFNGSILDNLTMFRGRAFYDEALALAAELGIDDFVARLPNGYDTIIDSLSHDQLPGGVRQRIAIIRAMVTKPKIVLFDEANTALDNDSDARLRKLLERCKGKMTMVLVSYRPSLLALAERRFEIAEGRLRPVARATAGVLTSQTGETK